MSEIKSPKLVLTRRNLTAAAATLASPYPSSPSVRLVDAWEGIMAVNNSESNYPPPVPPSRRSSEPAAPPDDFDLSDVGELMALNIGLEEPSPPEPVAPPIEEPVQPPALAPLPIPEPDVVEAANDAYPPQPTDSHQQTDYPPPADHPPSVIEYPPSVVDYQPAVESHAPAINSYQTADPQAAYPTPQYGDYQIASSPTPGAPPATAATSDGGPAALIMETLARSPWMVVGAAIAVLVLVATFNWLTGNWLTGSSSDDEAQGGSELLTTQDVSESEASIDGEPNGSSTASTVTELPPMSPAAIPPIDQPGLVGFEIDLFDPYSGRGTTGAVDLYLNAVSGQVCHQFEADVMTGDSARSRYRAYIHEATYPREGPIVVDLGETISGLPQCVSASPIEVARFMTSSDEFYIAAHSPERDVLLRGQLSTAATAFDNRDETTKAEQTVTAQASDTTPTTAGPDSLFGSAEEGAYLVVDAGKVTFEGAVADAATASRLQSAFIPLAGLGVEVVDNLTIESGAAAPSGRVVVADALLFGSGQDEIDGNPLVLTTLADLLRVNPTWTATITGHTDNVGEWLLNVDLSLRRANSIRGRLAQLGVPAERIRVQGAGPEQPIADNTTTEGRARNRRIEISISSGGK